MAFIARTQLHGAELLGYGLENDDCDDIQFCLDRLAEYEDTNLAPTEVAEIAEKMKQRDKGCGWCKKWQMEFNAIDEDGGTIAIDHMVVGGICDYCPVCGKKLTADDNGQRKEGGNDADD
jgi:hypothetical protein